MEPIDEIEESGAARHWVIVLCASAAIVAWGLLIYFSVRDRPREWDFGALPDAPSESIYSTAPPPETASPTARVLPQLPEARPWQIPAAPPTAVPAPAASSAVPTATTSPTAPASSGGAP